MSALHEHDRIPAWGLALVGRGLSSLSTTNLLILIHLGITLTLASKLNIGGDEAFSLHTTGKDVAYALHQALYFELQPPFYFVFLSVWRKLNSSILFARLPSILCIVLTIKIAAELSRRLLKEANRGWVVACVAVNPFTIWAAVEIRPYALVILLSAVLLLLFLDGFLQDAPRSSARWFYVLVAVLALYTQYYLGFLLLGNACALLFLRRWRALAVYLMEMGIVALCFSPMMRVVPYQVSAHVSPFIGNDGGTLSIVQSIGIIYWRIQEYLLPIGWAPLYFWRRWLLRLGFAALLALLLTKYRHYIVTEKIALWFATLTMTFCFVVVLRFTAEEVVDARHVSGLFLPITFSVFSLISAATHRKVLLVWVLTVLLFNSTALVAAYAPMAKRGDWIRVAAYISASEKPGQAILVFHGSSALPLAHHYRGPNPLVPIPNGDLFETPGMFFPEAVVLIEDKQIAEAVAPVAASPEVWLVTDWQRGFSADGIDDPVMKEFVARNYSVENSKTFYYSKVFLLRRKPVSK